MPDEQVTIRTRRVIDISFENPFYKTPLQLLSYVAENWRMDELGLRLHLYGPETASPILGTDSYTREAGYETRKAILFRKPLGCAKSWKPLIELCFQRRICPETAYSEILRARIHHSSSQYPYEMTFDEGRVARITHLERELNHESPHLPKTLNPDMFLRNPQA